MNTNPWIFISAFHKGVAEECPLQLTTNMQLNTLVFKAENKKSNVKLLDTTGPFLLELSPVNYLLFLGLLFLGCCMRLLGSSTSY